MKYNFLIICLLLCTLISAQGSDIHIEDFYYGLRGEENICVNDMKFTAYFSDGTSQIFFDHNSYRAGEHYRPNEIFSFDKKVISIRIYVYTRERRGSRSCDSGKGSEIRHEDPPFTVNMNPCSNGNYDEHRRNGGDFEVENRLKFSWFVTPRPNLQRIGSDIAGFEDDFMVEATSGFNTSIYRWQYQIVNSGQVANNFNWSDIPKRLENRNLNVKPSSFLRPSDIGKEIHIRILSCAKARSSNIITFRLRKSAPKILSISNTDVTCYDSIGADGKGDATITLQFDRALEAGDNLNVAVVDLSRRIGQGPDGNPLYATVESYESSEIIFDTNNTVTLEGLPHSTNQGFGISLIGGTFNGEVYYTGGSGHRVDPFLIKRPSYVEFIENKDNQIFTNVNCFEGDDATITINARGGVDEGKNYQYIIRTKDQNWNSPGVVWRPFLNPSSHVITKLNDSQGLSANTYYIKIRDRNKCEAKLVVPPTPPETETKLRSVIEREVIITQPDAPLDIQLEVLNEPTAFTFKDGRISAVISGGTKFNDNSYQFEWRDLAGNAITTTITKVDADNNYQVTLHSIGQGIYFLNAWDKNFDTAVNKTNCSYLNASITLTEPDLLEVSIEIENEISCNNGNEYFDFEDKNTDDIVDQFQDGVLVAHAKGGIRFEPGNPYQYNWRIEKNGIWQDLNRNDSIIDYLSTARYALNIKDKNGIELGTYVEDIQTDGSREYRLQSLKDSIKFLPQPEKLALLFDKTATSCAAGNDASAKVSVKGGTPPYTYSWSNGIKMANNVGLIAGVYIVFIEDAKGCQIEGSVTIEQPNGIRIDTAIEKNPVCYQGNDGAIEVFVSGGTPPYTFNWNTGETTTKLNNLSEGSYTLSVKDKNDCTAFYEVVLKDPDPVIVDLGENRSLCALQSLVLDIGIDDSGAKYNWSSDNGFSSTDASVELFEAGVYTATVTTGLGCTGLASVSVNVSNTPIDAHFIINTQAYTGEEVILVNISDPLGDKVDWTLPEGVQIRSESNEQLALIFDKAGPYDIHLRSNQGDCYQDFVKTIVVQPAIEAPEVDKTSGNFIEEFLVYPNSNTGVFKVKVSLSEFSDMDLKIINLVSAETIDQRTEKNQKEILIDYSTNLPTGVYVLLLETPKGSEIRKLIIE